MLQEKKKKRQKARGEFGIRVAASTPGGQGLATRAPGNRCSAAQHRAAQSVEPSLLYPHLPCASLSKGRPEATVSPHTGESQRVNSPGEETAHRSTNCSHEQRRAPPSRDANFKGLPGLYNTCIGKGAAPSKNSGSPFSSWTESKSKFSCRKHLETWLSTARKTGSTEDLLKASLPTELTHFEETPDPKGNCEQAKLPAPHYHGALIVHFLVSEGTHVQTPASSTRL